MKLWCRIRGYHKDECPIFNPQGRFLVQMCRCCGESKFTDVAEKLPGTVVPFEPTWPYSGEEPPLTDWEEIAKEQP